MKTTSMLHSLPVNDVDLDRARLLLVLLPGLEECVDNAATASPALTPPLVV